MARAADPSSPYGHDEERAQKLTPPYFCGHREAWILPEWNHAQVAEVVLKELFLGGLVSGLGGWWLYNQTEGIYRLVSEKAISAKIEKWLSGAIAMADNGKERHWPVKEAVTTSIMKSLDAATAKEGLSFRIEGDLVPIKDGFTPLFSKEMIPFSLDRFTTWKLNFSSEVVINGSATCPRWLTFLAEGFDRDRRECDCTILQEFFGYCLQSGAPLQRMLWLYGLAASGKSVIANTLVALLGKENVWAGSVDDLADKFNSDLLGKRLILLPDLRNDDRSGRKGLRMILNVVGQDPIRSQRKYRDAEMVTIDAKVMSTSNELPSWRDSTRATLRRTIPIHRVGTWENKQDSSLQSVFTGPELGGIFLWALEGLRRLAERGDFDQSKFDHKLLENAARVMNPVVAFVEDVCELKRDGAWISKATLYDEFAKWCRESGTLINMSREQFAVALKQTYPVVKDTRHGQVRGWSGILVR
ncbi:dsdna helicase [Bacteriophage sp.]|nr:dsdna helicase [Bacteriophage sp.]UOF80096.1 dsdna helicase [Bacteriophage sp.]